MNQRERMLSGLPYKAWLDGLEEDRQACKQKIYDFNQLPPSRQSKEAPQMIKNIFGKTGENVWVEAPFHCDYGWNIEVGENFYSNYNLTILDVGKVTCGKNVQIAPNVSIYTAGHPVHPDSRNSGYEYGIPVTVGDNVWIGGNTVILPGVTVGSNVVIGAGSVVSKDIPDNTIAAGNPCKVIREITDEDRIYYFKKQKFVLTSCLLKLLISFCIFYSCSHQKSRDIMLHFSSDLTITDGKVFICLTNNTFKFLNIHRL